MIVPEYWSEAKEQITVNGKTRTLKRFGWSDVSERDAYENAKQRVSEAVDRARAGEDVRRMDHKVPYNGAEGLPIREEIISRHDDSVITRNSYGALCLNTPDTLFADIDVDEPGITGFSWFFFLLFVAAGVWYSREFGTWWVLAVAVLVGAILCGVLATVVTRFVARMRPDPFGYCACTERPGAIVSW